VGRAALSGARSEGALALVLLALLVVWLGLSLGDTPRDPETGTAAVVEADSAWRLRRSALAATTARTAQVDGFLSFPEAIPCVDLPLYDELLAGLARLSVGKELGVAPGRIDGAALQRFGAWVAPVQFALLLALLYGGIRRAGVRTRAAVLGALVVLVAATVVVESGRPGRLQLELFAALLVVMQLRTLEAVGRAGQDLDRFMWSMATGAVTGLGLLTTPAFAIPTLGTWCAFVLTARAASGERRADVVRAALLFWLPAMVLAHVPAIGGPWVPAAEGPVAGWIDLVGDGALLGALPLLLLGWRPGRGPGSWPTRPEVWGLVTCLLLFLAVLTALLGPDRARGAAWLAALGQDAGAWRVAATHLLGPGLLALGLFAWEVSPRAEDEGGPFALLPGLGRGCVGLGCVGASLLEPSLWLFATLPLGLAVARFLERPPAWRWGLVPLALLGGILEPDRAAAREARGAGLEVLRAARWLRDHDEAPGAWSDQRGRAGRGVLAEAPWAPLVAWHAGWPCATLGPRRNGDRAGRGRLGELLSVEEGRGRVERLWAAGFAYVLVDPGGASHWERFGLDLRDLEGPPAPPGSRLLWRSPAPDGGAPSAWIGPDG